MSPFSEKIRKILALKNLEYREVDQPAWMPKPHLTPMTGGYRRIPVLQIGADIYCDTSRIARELERRHPDPTLFPGSTSGLAYALAPWADSFFASGAGLSMGLNDQLPADLVQDRREFFTHMDFDRLQTRAPHMFGQVLANVTLLEERLADGRAFLTADRPGLADASAYYVLWMCRGFIAAMNGLLEPFARVAAWEGRMRAIGHGGRSELEASAALNIARAASALPAAGVSPADPSGLAAGQRVTVTPDDYGKVPVAGELVTLDLHEIAVRRVDARAGEVVVHFPRLGYVVEAA